MDIDILREEFESNKTESMCMAYSNEDGGEYIDPEIEKQWQNFLIAKQDPAEYFKVVAKQEVIDAEGVGRRITEGGIYQNQFWIESKPGFVTVCDNKGCDTQIKNGWVEEVEELDYPANHESLADQLSDAIDFIVNTDCKQEPLQ